MNSRERVLTTFEHVEPDRVPIWCGASPEFWEKAKNELNLDDEGLKLRFHDDFRRVFERYVGPEIKLSQGAVYRTPFGVERHGIGYGQPDNHPLANATLKQVHEYSWPDPKWMDVSGIRSQAMVYNGQYAILAGAWAPFFHDVIDLLGMENMYLKMYDEPELVDAVIKHTIDYYFGISERIYAAAGDVIDIFFMANDFGSQNGPLLNVELFERFIAPHLKRMCDLARAYNLKTMLHCCGGFRPLIPLLIKTGFDALHAVQPCCQGMNLAKLKVDFGDKIVFNGAIDSHHVLLEGDRKFVRKKTKEVLRIMMPGGGYIGGASHDTILEETPLENVLEMLDTLYELGRYTVM